MPSMICGRGTFRAGSMSSWAIQIQEMYAPDHDLEAPKRYFRLVGRGHRWIDDLGDFSCPCQVALTHFLSFFAFNLFSWDAH